MVIDLHLHTKYSDGNHSVTEVLKMAEVMRNKIKLEIISITDHDSVTAYQDLKNQELRKLYQGKIISGVELSFNLDNHLYDVLGYNINADQMLKLLDQKLSLAQRLAMQNNLLIEFMKMCDKKGIEHQRNLQITTGNIHEAFNVGWADISNFKKHPKNKKFKEYLDQNNIANFFKKYFSNPDSDFFVNEAKYSPTLKEAITMIHDCGGQAFLAHSFAYGLSNTEAFIEYAINCGLDGIEKYYSTHTKEQEKIIQDYADQYNLLISGGTDFHGEKSKPGIKIGIGKGNMKISIDTIKEWLNN